MKFLKLKNCNCCYQTLFYNDWTTCFNWKYSKKTRKLSKNDKFVTNKTIFFYFVIYSLPVFYGIKTKLLVDSFYFSSCILSETYWMRAKKWYNTEKDEKVTYKQHTTKWFFPVLRFLLFSVIPTFEENLYM